MRKDPLVLYSPQEFPQQPLHLSVSGVCTFHCLLSVEAVKATQHLLHNRLSEKHPGLLDSSTEDDLDTGPSLEQNPKGIKRYYDDYLETQLKFCGQKLKRLKASEVEGTKKAKIVYV